VPSACALHVKAVCAGIMNRIAIPVPPSARGLPSTPWKRIKTMRLIDLADKRLYVAKERGRKQINRKKVTGKKSTVE